MEYLAKRASGDRGLPILGTKTWTSKEEAATFVCIEREKQQKRLSERDMLLEIALFCPNRELHRGALQADSVDYSTFWSEYGQIPNRRSKKVP